MIKNLSKYEILKLKIFIRLEKKSSIFSSIFTTILQENFERYPLCYPPKLLCYMAKDELYGVIHA